MRDDALAPISSEHGLATEAPLHNMELKCNSNGNE